MNYKIKEITEKQAQQFYDSYEKEKTFNQIAKFREFRAKVGEKSFLFGIFTEIQHPSENKKSEKNKLIGIAGGQMIKRKLGTFFHVPHGPLVDSDHRPGAFESFLEFYKQFGKQNGADFVRLSPLMPPDYADLLAEYEFKPAVPYMVNPERTLTLDLNLNEEELLQQMSKTTRYEVRQGIKKGIEVKMGNDEADLKHFWDLHEQTFARQGFTPFKLSNTKKEIEVFGDDAQIFTAFSPDDDTVGQLFNFV